MDQSERMKMLIRFMEEGIPAPEAGLPEDVLLSISGLTPLVNVDLLVQDAIGRKLLTWRDDDYYGPGWHVPGGIIRFKETAHDRVRAVARAELGAEVAFDDAPVAIIEYRHPVRRSRGHFISLLYRCRLLNAPDEQLRFDPAHPQPGHWKWHEHCPENLIADQDEYRKYLDAVLVPSPP